MYKGIAGSEGIGIGTVVLIEEHEINIETKRVEETGAEIERLQNAIEKFVADTNVMAEKMDITVGKKDADILRGHIQMLQDPMIEEQISALVISEKITAEMAVEQVLEQTAEMFSQIPDELLQQRATDFRDIKTRMLKILHASANILMIPEVNRFSTVSTSPTNLDTRAPGSWRFSSLAERRPNFSIRLLRSACVIFWPNTVRRLSLADSRKPVRASSPKYSRIPPVQRV